MIDIVCEQGTPEWHLARVGVITASMFSVARAKGKVGDRKGLPTKAAEDYARRLAIQRGGGKALDEQFANWGMDRGKALEPKAREEHELTLGELVRPVGFCKTDCGRFGVSLDGRIGKKGGAEYKAYANSDKLLDIILENDLSGVMDQVQGGIWIAELDWLDFVLYCPELAPLGSPIWHQRVWRDEAYIGRLVDDLASFDALVEDYITRLRRALTNRPIVTLRPAQAGASPLKIPA